MSDYKIVDSSIGLDHLQDCVNQFVKEGYVPIGGVFPTSFNYGQPSSFAQAMFRQEKVDK